MNGSRYLTHSGPLPKVELTDPKVVARYRWSVAAWTLATLILLWRLAFLHWALPGTWMLFGVSLAFQFFLLNRILANLGWHSTTLILGPEALRIYRAGRHVADLPYNAVSRCRFSDKGGEKWLTFERNDGLPNLEIGHSGFSTKGLICKSMIATVLNDSTKLVFEQQTRPEPESPLAIHLWKHHGAPPASSLRVGGRYRYIGAGDLSMAVSGISWPLAVAVLMIQIPRLFFILFPQIAGPAYLVFVFFVPAVALILASFLDVYKLAAGRKDLIEVIPNGLNVTRHGRTWRVEGPPVWVTRRVGLALFRAPALRYGRGLRSYYVFPGFLEETN